MTKNNLTSVDSNDVKYEAYHNVMGSDHRPVTLTVNLNLSRRKFCDINSDKKTGVIDLIGVDLMGVDFIKMFKHFDIKLPIPSALIICT